MGMRTGLVIMLSNYLEQDTISQVLSRTCAMLHVDFYYVQMAQSWLLATAWAKFSIETNIHIQQSALSINVLQKFVQKFCGYGSLHKPSHTKIPNLTFVLSFFIVFVFSRNTPTEYTISFSFCFSSSYHILSFYLTFQKHIFAKKLAYFHNL